MKSIEYILSGTSYTRIHSNKDLDQEILESNKEIIGQLRAESKHKFGMLFNAFQEANYGKHLEKYSDVLDSIHADSGGLQIITLGKTITEEMKDKIYRIQAAHATYGMCFDEIPIQVAGGKSVRNDTTNRIFDRAMLDPCAKLTAKNIERQIDIFLEEKTECKPILIAQGNCYDTYMRWVDVIMQTIPQEKHQYIGGVAMGAAALGTGALEDFDRAFYFSQLPMEKKYLHVLGIGSAKRILPYIMMHHNGLYPADLSMSYDSTTHSCGIEFGTYFKGGRAYSFTRHWSNDYDIMFDDLQARYPQLGIEKFDFLRLMNSSGGKSRDEYGYSMKTILNTRLAIIMSNVINFCLFVDSIHDSKKAIKQFIASNKDLSPVTPLLDIRDIVDYNKWKADMGRFLASDRIATQKANTLESFFE